MAESICPPLGTGSVDLNALHDAARKGDDLALAVEQATTRVEPDPELVPVPAMEAQAPATKAEKPAAAPQASA